MARDRAEARIITEKHGDRWCWYIISNYKETAREHINAIITHGSAATEAEAEKRASRRFNEIMKTNKGA